MVLSGMNRKVSMGEVLAQSIVDVTFMLGHSYGITSAA